ncbi:MAG: Asp-tRNA(Asn)/Glu-tRNA(Gln) amidotransferase subunit GatC [Steroidobacteraceae bacterium]
MSLGRRDIENIAHLARLALAEPEVPVYVDSLSRIIELVGQLDRAATAGVEPMSHPLPGLSQRLREDAVSETDRHELYQRNAPQVSGALYLVPRVIE